MARFVGAVDRHCTEEKQVKSFSPEMEAYGSLHIGPSSREAITNLKFAYRSLSIVTILCNAQ